MHPLLIVMTIITMLALLGAIAEENADRKTGKKVPRPVVTETGKTKTINK